MNKRSHHFRVRTPLRTLETLETRHLLAAVSIVASQDNSLFEDSAGALSNGVGEYLFAGRTKQAAGRSLRRALVAFDLENQIPEAATITKVELSLHITMAISGDVPMGIHRVSQAWGEGVSDAAQEEGRGIDSTPGDATWLHAEFPAQNWTTPGGDFLATASATANVGTRDTDVIWSSDQMIADVTDWISNPDANFGWVILGGESLDGTAKRFNSRENPSVETRPTLTIEYEDVPLNTTPWQNQQNHLDVTGDGEIVPRDVLFIVNYINSNGPGPLPSPGDNEPPPFYDVTGDNEITARDALLIINFINAQGNGEPEMDTDMLFALSLLNDDE